MLDGDPASPQLKGHSPLQFLSNVRCGQTTGWMKTPLGTEVDLGPGHIVLDGVLALRKRGTAAPVFSAHVYCGHGRASQLLLSSCLFLTFSLTFQPKNIKIDFDVYINVMARQSSDIFETRCISSQPSRRRFLCCCYSIPQMPSDLSSIPTVDSAHVRLRSTSGIAAAFSEQMSPTRLAIVVIPSQ